MTWQLSTPANISDIIYHQPACQSSHSVQKITAPPSKEGTDARAGLRTADSDDLPAAVCYPWVCCQKIIMPINFTHAGVAPLSSSVCWW